MLHRIEMVTLGCADPAMVEAAYCGYLHYRRVGAGQISTALARLWGLETAAGTNYTLLAPQRDTTHFIRLLQVDAEPPPPPFSTAGWNAAEILVNDVDSLAQSLADSPFAVAGPPADLSFTDNIRACQVVGPAGEALYLTQIKGDIPGFSLAPTDQVVAWCFVMILAVASLPAAKEFYRTRFAFADAPDIDARVTMMSAAHELPRAHLHRISALTLGDPGYLLELDELPAASGRGAARQGLLPTGIAMVSFSCASPQENGDNNILAEPPYNGRRVGFCAGPAGEMLELIYL